MVPSIADARANLAEDKEVVNTLIYGEIGVIERPAVDVLFCIETERVNAHIDILHIARVQIIRNLLVFSVNVNAVARHLTGLLTGLLIIHSGGVVIIKRGVQFIGLHAVEPCSVLSVGIVKCAVIRSALCKRSVGIDLHTIKAAEVLNGIVLLVKHMTELVLTEVTGVVPYNVLNNLHALCVNSVNQRLKIRSAALVTGIYL